VKRDPRKKGKGWESEGVKVWRKAAISGRLAMAQRENVPNEAEEKGAERGGREIQKRVTALAPLVGSRLSLPRGSWEGKEA